MTNSNLKEIGEEVYRKYLASYSKSFEKKVDQKFTAYLYIVLTLFTVSFLGIFAIKPTFDTISNLNKQYEDNQIINNGLIQKLSAFRQLDSQYSVIKTNLSSIFTAIPKTNNIPYLTRQIEEIAKNGNLTLTKLDFGAIELYPAVKGQQPLYSFTFNLAVDGSEESINTFIKNMISFDRIVAIEKITTGKSTNNKFGASITGKSFFLTE